MKRVAKSTKIWVNVGILILVLVLSSCNAVKNVKENQLLLTKNTITVENEQVKTEEVRNLLLQQPNTSILGYPLRLNLHNLAKQNPDSSYLAWLNKKEKRKERLAKLLSQKQVKRLGNSFAVKGYSELLKRIGEPPAIIDTTKTRKSKERLYAYYYERGYFNNKVSDTLTLQKRKKRAKLGYHVSLGEPFFINSFEANIPQGDLQKIYEANKEEAQVKNNQQFDLNNFQNERQRLTTLFRNSGVYNFQETAINFDVGRDTTTLGANQKMDVTLNIKEFPSNANTTDNAPYSIHSFKTINIYPDYNPEVPNDSLSLTNFKGYTIWHQGELAYKPKSLTDAIFLRKTVSIQIWIERVP